MKRSESYLVYGVTGLLAVILIVAVVFGDDQQAPLQSGEQAKAGAGDGNAMALQDVLDYDPTRALEELDEEGGDDAAADGTEDEGEDASEPVTTPDDDLAVPGAQPAADGVVGEPVAAGGTAEGQPSEAAAEASAPTREELLQGDLGVSERVGDFRRVRVRRGDTFSGLIQHWCGSLQQRSLAEALNETTNYENLRVGDYVLLPWVDEAVLLERRKEALMASRRLDSETGQAYTVKTGDSLWEIAVQRAGSANHAPAYIQRILALNPGMEPDRLRAGQAIRLP